MHLKRTTFSGGDPKQNRKPHQKHQNHDQRPNLTIMEEMEIIDKP
jgi:hypothetical protein